MPANLEFYQLLARLRRDNVPCALAIVVAVTGSTSGRLGDKALFSPAGRRLSGWIGGGCVERETGAAAVEALQTGQSKKLLVDLDGEDPLYSVPCGGKMTVLVEPLPARPQLLIIGSGRLVEVLTELGRLLDFNLAVQTDPDHQADYPAADQVATGPLDWDSLDPRPQYVVLASHHPDEGLMVLQALQSGVPYVALVASRKRTGLVQKFLVDNGLPAEDFKRLRAPAGLDLGAADAPEIALSILAEIVMHRRGGKAVPLSVTADQTITHRTGNVT